MPNNWQALHISFCFHGLFPFILDDKLFSDNPISLAKFALVPNFSLIRPLSFE